MKNIKPHVSTDLVNFVVNFIQTKDFSNEFEDSLFIDEFEAHIFVWELDKEESKITNKDVWKIILHVRPFEESNEIEIELKSTDSKEDVRRKIYFTFIEIISNYENMMGVFRVLTKNLESMITDERH